MLRFGRFKVVSAGLLLCLSTACTPGGSGSGASDEASKLDSAKTAQGIMIDVEDISNLAITTTEVYKLNESTAESHYTNWINNAAGVLMTCTGSPADCALTNAPSVPAAPAPDASRTATLVFQNRCVFLDGGSPSSLTYTQSVSIKGKNNKGNFTFTYTYSIASSGPVDPFTAWDLFHSSADGGSLDVNLNATIAGLSVVKNSNPKIGTKYSFSLSNADGTPRVENLQVSLNDTVIGNPGVTVETNCPGCLAGDTGALDFNFAYNAAVNGDVSLLKQGDARSILNNDSFSGNDNGGSDGLSLARARIDSLALPVQLGANTLTITGSVKGIDSSTSTTFTASKQVHVVTPGCGQDQAL